MKTEGDAFMVSFRLPSEAVAWAVAAQLALLDCVWPDELLALPDAAYVANPGPPPRLLPSLLLH